jgi:hypothetical protein
MSRKALAARSGNSRYVVAPKNPMLARLGSFLWFFVVFVAKYGSLDSRPHLREGRLCAGVTGRLKEALALLNACAGECRVGEARFLGRLGSLGMTVVAPQPQPG